MRGKSRFLAFVAALSLCSPVQGEPLKTGPGGLVSAPVTVNGQGPFDFIVDTAASQTVILPSLQERLSLQAGPDDVSEVIGASGNATVQVFSLKSIALDGRRRAIVRAGAAPGLPPMGTVQGIIGSDFLREYRVDFDLAGGAIRLIDPMARGIL